MVGRLERWWLRERPWLIEYVRDEWPGLVSALTGVVMAGTLIAMVSDQNLGSGAGADNLVPGAVVAVAVHFAVLIGGHLVRHYPTIRRSWRSRRRG